jgi:hypothetical protein
VCFRKFRDKKHLAKLHQDFELQILYSWIIQKEEEFIISLNEINAKIKDIGYSKTDKADIKKAENIKKSAEESLSKFTEEDLIKSDCNIEVRRKSSWLKCTGG